jgi:hydrogenase maturation protease
VRVVDFGIRGLDLAFTLLQGYDGVILIDVAQRGRPPGTLTVIEPDPADAESGASAELADGPHGMHPVRVLRLVREMGGRRPWMRVVVCEPVAFGSEEDPALGLSPPVAAAVEGAVELVEELAASFLATF